MTRLVKEQKIKCINSYLFMDAIGFVAIFALVGQLCGYGFNSAQLLIFNDVFISPFSTKIVLVLLGLVVVLLSSKARVVKVIFIPTIILFFYLLVLAVACFLSGKDPYYMIVGFNDYYSMFFIFMAAYQMRGYASDVLLARIIGYIGLPAISLGMLQFFFSLPFPSPQPDAPILFFSSVRAYSFFGEPAQYSIFLLFVFSFFGSMLLRYHRQGARRGHAILVFLYLIITVIAAYTTLTRSLLLAVCAATFTLVIINIKFSYKYAIVYVLPFFYLLLIIFLLFNAHDISRIFSDSLTSGRSVSLRFEEWHYYSKMLFGSTNVFFAGNGIVQGNQTSGPLNAVIPIDNTFLGVAINIGLVGLFLFLLVMCGIWVFLVNEAKIKGGHAIESALVFFSTWPVYAVIGNLLYLYPLCLLIYLIGDRESNATIRSPL